MKLRMSFLLLSFLLPLLAAAWPAFADSKPLAVQAQFTRGQLLIAAPHMPDPRFAKSVIYMVDHDERGAFGLIINRPVGSGPLDEFVKGFGVEPGEAEGDITLHYGGPVEPGRIFVLHSADWKDMDKTELRGPIAMTSDVGILEAMARNEGPKKSLVVFGYAGWAPNQLEGEMARDDWITAPADFSLIFDTAAESKWDRAFAIGGVPL
ncbi:MAG: YqgE/AlgH family protein [Rhodospirillales bacterium]|nr:YqgE/AlgH family protein [Rhodospirillales bacterium]